MTHLAARASLLLGLLLIPTAAFAQPVPKPKKPVGTPKAKPGSKPKADKKKTADKKKADKKKKKKKAEETKRVGRKRPPHRPLVIKNARIDGQAREVALMVVGGKIAAILPRAPGRLPRGTVVLDAKGGRVVPGRIDAWASIGDSAPLGNALDAFDAFDRHAIEQTLAQGVTTLFLNPSRGGGIAGVGAVIKLFPGWSGEEMIVVDEVAVCASLALGTQDPLQALRELQALEKTFAAASAYRDKWLDYEEALEKYVKALPKTKAKPKAKGKTPPKKGKTPPKKGKTPPKKGKRPVRRPRRPRRPVRRPVRRTPTKKAPAKPGAKPGAKKKKGPKKPKRPKVDRAKALLVQVLQRKLPLRVEAHRVEDIVNLLELQDEYKFRLILEGATEAHLVADVLAKRKIPVVLGQVRVAASQTAYPRAYRADNAARLEAAGVQVVIGSDGWPMARNLGTNADLAAEAGLKRASAEAAITSRAAELLGLEKVGKVARGYLADLVVLRKDFLGSEVTEAVLVEGHVVYRRKP